MDRGFELAVPAQSFEHEMILRLQHTQGFAFQGPISQQFVIAPSDLGSGGNEKPLIEELDRGVRLASPRPGPAWGEEKKYRDYAISASWNLSGPGSYPVLGSEMKKFSTCLFGRGSPRQAGPPLPLQVLGARGLRRDRFTGRRHVDACQSPASGGL